MSRTPFPLTGGAWRLVDGQLIREDVPAAVPAIEHEPSDSGVAESLGELAKPIDPPAPVAEPTPAARGRKTRRED